MNETEPKEWWKKRYTDEELKAMGKDKLLEMMKELPRDSEEQNRVFNIYSILNVKETRSWDVTRTTKTPVKSKEIGENVIENKPIYNVRRITCVSRGEGSRGWDECLIASSEGDFNAKHVDVIGLKPKTVNKMGINPNGMTIETQPFNAYLAGNAIVDYDFRTSFERGNVGEISTMRELMRKMEKAELISLHRFDWEPRDVPEKVKALFRKKKD